MNSKLTKEKGYACSVEEVAQRYKRMMGYHSYRVDGRKWMLHFNRSGEAMDWLIDRMTTASSVGGDDLTPVMEHWYEDPENINGEFPGTHEFLDGPQRQGPRRQPAAGRCARTWRCTARKPASTSATPPKRSSSRRTATRWWGVIAKSGDGYVRVNGKNGVVIATGDFGQDKDMLEKFIPWAGASDRVRRHLGRLGPARWRTGPAPRSTRARRPHP